MAINKTVRNAIADDAITSDKIEDGAITSGKLGAGNISLSKTPLGNAAPTISSLDTSQINPDSGATVTITGTGFVSIPDVKFMNTSTGVRVQASTVGFVSSTTITGAFPSGQTPGTYKVLVENTDGKGAISTSTITYSAAPTWSTAANLGSIEEGEAVNIQLLAYDDDSTAVSSYSLVSGSLPSGVTLSGDSSVGSLTGTAPAVDADTNFTFTIRATDDEGQTSDREFTLTITNWTVANSLRFDDGSSDNLTRTTDTPDNRDKFTISAWVKLSSHASKNPIVAFYGSNDYCSLMYNDERIQFIVYDGGTIANISLTSRHRDFSAWYHIVVAVDSTQATSSNRVKIYVNGEQENSLTDTTYPSQNADIIRSTMTTSAIGRSVDQNGTNFYFDGYLAEVVCIDNQQLDPTSFGETDTSGIWKPKSVSGLTFGTNGFYLPFTNSGSLGADSSGNSNNFTVNNLTAIDQTTDTPVNNFTTFNAVDVSGTSIGTFSQGNTYGQSPNTSPEFIGRGTLSVSSGKWYWEAKCVSIDVGSFNNFTIGIDNVDSPITNSGYIGSTATSYSYAGYSGNKFNNNSGTSFGSTLAVNDIVGVALDMDNGFIYFSKNGTWQNSGDPTSGASGTGSAFSSISGTYTPAFSDQGSSVSLTIGANFGNPAYSISSGNSDANGYGNFEYAVPSGYFALNTKNLAEYG